MKKITLIFSLFLMVFYAQAQEDKSQSPVIVIKLMEGEAVKVEDASLQFEKVISDSRCPSDVTCVWQGEAKVKLSLRKRGNLIEAKEIVLTNPLQNGAIFTLGQKKFKIYGIMPYPTSKMKSEGNMNYYLQLEVLNEAKSDHKEPKAAER